MTSLALALSAALAAPAEAPLAEPMKRPAEDLRALIDAASDPDANAVVVLDRTTVRVEDSGLAHYRRRQVIKLLKPEGAKDLATLRFDYDPASNMVEVTRARVHRKGEGEPVDLPAERIRDLPQPQHYIYWGPRMKVLSVPRLEPGDAIEVETYTKGFIIALLDNGGGDERFIPPMRGHFYAIVLFGDEGLPTLERRYAVTLPRDKPLQYEVYNGEIFSSYTYDDSGHTYTWWKTDLPAHNPEPRAADASDYLPKVVMSTSADWQAKSRWFYEVNESQFEANDAIREKMREITRDADSAADKIDAILHWTAQEIRYSGISMGKGEGYVLHSGQTTFNDRAGVCKDIAGMSITLLRAAGFTSYPAMTMAGSRVERIPADQFNHCVVAVKTPEGFRMIDPTWAPFSAELWSSAEREQHYLVGTPEGAGLMMTSYLPPEHNTLNVRATTTIEENGDLFSSVVIMGSGYPEDRLRRQIAGQSVLELHASMQEMITRVAPAAVIDRLQFNDYQNLKQPVRIELRYRVPGYANVGKNVMSTHLPTSSHLLGNKNFADWLSATETDTRKSAIWLRSPQRVSFEETIAVPSGMRLVGLPLEEQTETPLGSVRLVLKQTRDTLRLNEVIHITQRNIAPAAYPDLKKVADAVRANAERRIYLTRGGRS